MGYMDRAWRGEFGLAASFWLGGVAAPVVLFIPLGLAAWYFESRGLFTQDGVVAFPLVEVLTVAYILFLIAAMICIFIAVWRSANRYRGPRHWPALAKAALIAGAGGFVWIMFGGG